VRDKADTLRGLRVIDCSTCKVIPAPRECKYVALSYVWGKPTEGKRDGEEEGLKTPPPIIADAVVATQKLGYQYLWVDRFCIDQENAKEKHYQIRNMDLIYGGATITLIAAAGEDTSFSLPGVGATARPQMPCVRVRGWLLGTIPPNPQYEVEQSKWSTRGWTYQEALLSPRRLVFTKSQLYFQCNKMGCLESVSYPLKERETTGCWQTFMLVFPMGGIGSSAEFARRLHEYIERDLSYPSDILNAFLGILGAFERQEPSFFHVCGVPIHIKNRSKINGVMRISEGDMTKAFSLGLGWTAEKGVTRRQDFPSWSWAGWNWQDSAPLWHLRDETSERSVTRIPISFEFQLKDGRYVTWASTKEFNRVSVPDADNLDSLKVRSWSVNCRCGQKHSYSSTVKLNGLSPALTRCKPWTSFTLDELGVQPNEDCKAIVLKVDEKNGVWKNEIEWCGTIGFYDYRMWSIHLTCLLVRRVVDHYERVGTGSISFDSYHQLKVGEDGAGYIEDAPAVTVEQLTLR
jgi:hypothetical protein